MPVSSRPPALDDFDLRIRRAEAADLDSLAHLEAAAFATDRLSRTRLRALARSDSVALLVADSGGVLIGYVLVLTRRKCRAARLYSLAVAPAVAGQGVGARLLHAGEAAARFRGAEEMRLEVRADNHAAIRLYERRGYVPIGRREDYYADGMSALRYARDLGTPPVDRDEPPLGRAA